MPLSGNKQEDELAFFLLVYKEIFPCIKAAKMGNSYWCYLNDAGLALRHFRGSSQWQSWK